MLTLTESRCNLCVKWQAACFIRECLAVNISFAFLIFFTSELNIDANARVLHTKYYTTIEKQLYSNTEIYSILWFLTFTWTWGDEKNMQGAVYWCYKCAPSFMKLSRADLKSYPGQANTLFLTLTLMKNECDISDDPYLFQFSLNYLERIRCYGPDKRKLMDKWMETLR